MTTEKITVAKIDKEIATFTANRDALKALGHKVAMMIVYHAAPKAASDECNGTGDCTRALALMEALPKSWAAQYQTWLGAFTPIRVNVSAGNVGYDKKYQKLSAEEKLAWWKIEEANTTPFYDFSKEPEVKPFDFAALKKLLDRLPNQIQKKINDGLVSDEDMATMLAAKEQLEGLVVRKVKPLKVPNREGDNDTITASEETAPLQNVA